MQQFRNVLIGLINEARTKPTKAAERLYEELSPNYRNDELHYFDKKIDTLQGRKGLDNYKNWLSNNPPVEYLIQSEALNRAAQALAEIKKKQGKSDHEEPRVIYDLINKFGKVEGKVGELMCLGGHTS